jgi:hypothetical protein
MSNFKLKNMISSKEEIMNEIINKLYNNDPKNKFSLFFLENMRDHSERYLRKRVSNFYDKMCVHNYPDKDISYLKNINQNHYGMVIHDYFPSRPIKKRDLGQRGMIKLIVDSSIAEDFYKILIKKKYLVIKVHIGIRLERESNFTNDEVELEWKLSENGEDKIGLKSVWYNEDDDPEEDEPILDFFQEAMVKYYSLNDLRMYTKIHNFYHFTIIDNQETSSDFISRLFDVIVKQYGRFENNTFKDECDCIYLNAYVPLYAENNDIEINDVDTNGFFCANALKKP